MSTGRGTGLVPARAARGNAGTAGSAGFRRNRRLSTGYYLFFRRSLADPDGCQALCGLRPAGLRPGDAGGRGRQQWPIEHAFKAAKQEVGLDDYGVRSAHGWCRHVTLVL